MYEEENPKKESEEAGKLTEEDILRIKKEPDNDKSQEKSHNKIIAGFFITLLSFVILFIVVSLIVKSSNNFSYRGWNFR